MTSEALITIIMPCYNASATIRDAIASIQCQSLSDWELIVVDDGSSDDSPALVRAIGEPRLRLFTQPNQGSAAARNHGLRHAAGRYIAFLDADDSWSREFLEKMLHALEARDDAVLAYCGWQNLGIEGGRGKPYIPPDYEPLDRSEVLLGGCRWPIHGVLVRHRAIEEAGGFDERLQASVDYDLWLRVAPRGKLVRVPEVLAYYHHHEGEQITKNKLSVALNHWRAQNKYLEQHPDEARRLGRKRVRELVQGELLRRAYTCYWNRDLATARALFRMVMRAGYGRPRDWVYMLPALLPQSAHAWLLRKRDMSIS
ncbi:MAG: glycosyltransferase [Gammaproteobacteria bacterium]|nr:glycosyltransferase [Gammaproteobacteria bacterium]